MVEEQTNERKFNDCLESNLKKTFVLFLQNSIKIVAYLKTEEISSFSRSLNRRVFYVNY